MSRQNGEQPTRRLTVAELLAQHGKADLGSGAGRRRRRRAPEPDDGDTELTTTAPHEIIERIRAEQGNADVQPRRRNGHSIGELDTQTQAVHPEPAKPAPPEAPDSATTRTDIKPAVPRDVASRTEMPPVRPPHRDRTGGGFSPAPPPGERTGTGFTPAPPPSDRNGAAFPPVAPPGGIADRLSGLQDGSASPGMPRRPGQPPKPMIKPGPPFLPPPRRPVQQIDGQTEQFEAVADDYADAGIAPDHVEQDLADDDYAYGDELDYVEDEELDGYDDGVEHDDYGDLAEHDDLDDDYDELTEHNADELLADEVQHDEELDEADEESELSPARQWLAVGVQLALGVVGGAGVWLLFNWLWNQLPVVALGTALVVTAGLVWIVRKIRKAEDMQSTLLAVLVGLVVTVSPAMLLLLSR